MNTKKVRAYVSALVLLCSACHEKTRALSPDYAIDFGCGRRPQVLAVETFMQNHGFKFFDEEGAREKRGHSFFVLQVDGRDPRRVMLNVIGLRQPPSYGGGVAYKLTITGPPPSQHDARLEQDSRSFVSKTLECQIWSAERYDNGPESAGMFESVYGDELRRIRELGD